MVKLGRPPAGPLSAQPGDWVDLPAGMVCWRVHRSAGAHVVPWDRLRYYGPAGARFDPHPAPPGLHPVGVTYAAADLLTALAEVFQQRRVINTVRSMPYATSWLPSRQLRLLDLTGLWPVRAGASQALAAGRHDLSQAWAQAISSTWPDADGLLYRSAMTGRVAVALWTAAADSFPARPVFSLPLADPGLRAVVAGAARQIGYRLI